MDYRYKAYVDSQTQTWPPGTEQKCKDFVQCLKNEHTMAASVVVSIARALDRQAPSLIEGAGTGRNGQRTLATGEECFQPSNLTFAALVECQCLEDLVAICGDPLVEDAVGCLFNHACDHPKVCSDWKSSNCQHGGLLMLSGRQESTHPSQLPPISDEAILAIERKEIEALRTRSRAGGFAALVSEDAALESTLQDKCS
jgi:hypothetical protein